MKLAGIALDKTLAELLNLLRNADEIGIIMRQQTIITMRDNHAVIPENHAGQHALRQLDIPEGNPGQRGFTLDFRLEQADFAMGEILHIEGRRRHQYPIDFVSRNELWIQHQVNVKVVFEIILGLTHELHIANPRNRMLDAMLFCQNAADHIDFVAGGHGNEDIRVTDIRIVHGNRAGAIGRNGEHVQRVLGCFQLALILVHNDYIKLFF